MGVKQFFLIFLFLVGIANAQIINAYAKVTAISGTSLQLSNVNESAHTFSVGGEVIVMQMQDDCIGTNTTNVATFGNVGSIANAGVYEIKTITFRSPSVGTPTLITLSSALVSPFNTGANSSVQVITFRNLGANYTTTANITGLAWNGNVGGVIAAQVTNSLILNHSINANTIGFRGGVVSTDYHGPVCANGNQSNYISSSTVYGGKGEGIYKVTNVNFQYARGRIVNGAGGGGDHNAGGGGGSNYTAGGQGGNGYNNCTAYAAGGLGGLALSPYINGSRVFLGGGGGGGQQNNSVGTRGGIGGGIILLKASALVSGTTCSGGISITANGETAPSTAGGANDAAGGGGAAGSIVLKVNTYSISGTCPLTVAANAGNGGNCTTSEPHAGGGGGAQGVIIYSTPAPTVNVTSQTLNGTPGTDNGSGTIVTSGTAGGGSNNSGILINTPSPLPLTVIHFETTCLKGSDLYFKWITEGEKRNSSFVLEGSSNGGVFQMIKQINGKGNGSERLVYDFVHTGSRSDWRYFRLKETEPDGTVSYTKTYYQDCSGKKVEFSVIPNPFEDRIKVKVPGYFSGKMTVYSGLGEVVDTLAVVSDKSEGDEIVWDLPKIPAGIYYMVIYSADEMLQSFKLIKQAH